MPATTSGRFIGAASLLGVALVVAATIFLRSEKECRAEPPPARAPGAGERLPVEVLIVAPQAFETEVPATGNLLPQESVVLVSELSRRLLKIHAEEGQPVKKGAVLFELDGSELRAERRRLEVSLALAKRTAERQANLLKDRVTSEAEADAANTDHLAIETELKALDVELAKTVIRAPFEGTLGLRRVSEGAWVTPATPLISLQDTSRLKIDFQVPERHAAAVKQNSEFFASVEGIVGTVTGHIIAMEPGIDEVSRSLDVRGVLEPRDGLVPGMFAKVALRVTTERAILVPAIAVIPGVDGRGVYVEREGKAVLVPVEIGARTPEKVEISKGLSEGDRLIVSNLLRVRDGLPVRAVGQKS